MILTLMLIILTATLVIVIIGFVMDRMAVTAIKSGMRTLNKRIKKIEKEICPDPIIIKGPDSEDIQKALANLEKMNMEDVTYEAVEVDTDADKEAQAKDGGALFAEAEGDL